MTIADLWDEHGFNICVTVCISFILIIGLYNIFNKKEGTWSNKYSYTPDRVLTSSTYKNKYNQNNEPTTPSTFATSKGEIECRRVLEHFFPSYKFPNFRPSFMKNEITKSNLELDCYCDELKLAVEYSGKQHYEYMPYFHANKDQFRTQQYRDLMKRDLCEKNGVILIEVPYTVKIKDIESFLYKSLCQKGLNPYH